MVALSRIFDVITKVGPEELPESEKAGPKDLPFVGSETAGPIEWYLGDRSQTYDASVHFSGEGLTYELEGTAAATIDPATGILSGPADALVDDAITITVSNDAGSVELPARLFVRDKTIRALGFGNETDRFKLTTNSDDVVPYYVEPKGAFANPGDGLNYSCKEPLSHANLTAAAAKLGNSDFTGPASGWLAAYQTKNPAAHRYLYFQFIQPAGVPMRVGIVWANRSGGTQGKAYFGTRPASSAYGIVTTGTGTSAYVGTLDLDPQPDMRSVCASIRVVNNVGSWEGIQFIWIETLDGSVCPDFLDQDGGGYSLPGEPATYYVAPETGDDLNDGLTSETPKLKAPPNGAPAGSTLVFKGGEAYRHGLIQIGASGTEQDRLIYDLTGDTFGTGPAILDGGQEITGWTDEGSNIWSAPLPDDLAMITQDDVVVPYAQLPTPSDPYYTDNVDEFAIADGMTSTTVTAKSWFEANFTDPSTLVGQAIALVWDSDGNYVRTRNITAYNAATGTITLDSRFIPYSQADRKKFAIYNHPDCMTQPGQRFTRKPDDRLVMRPYGDADPATVQIDNAGPRSAVSISGNFVTWKGGLIKKFAGSQTVLMNRCEDCVIDGLEMTLNNPKGSTNYMIYEKGGLRNRFANVYTHDNSGGYGFFLDESKDCLIHDSQIIRHAKGTCLKVTKTEGCFVMSSLIGLPLGTHANGFSAYIENKDLTILGCDILATGIALTLQQTKAGLRVVGNTLIVPSDSIVLGQWGPVEAATYSIGEQVISNNVILGNAGSSRCWAINSQMHQADSFYVNNVFDGNGPSTDKRFDTRQGILSDEFTLVDPGAGHTIGPWLPASGGTGSPAYIDINSTASLPVSLEEISVESHGLYDTLPPDLTAVEFWSSTSTSPIIISTSAAPAWPELVTKNIRTGWTAGVGPSTAVMAEVGDVLAKSERATMFVDIDPGTDWREWNVRPSGTYDLSGGHEWTMPISHPLLPSAPASITFNWQGRYKMDGTEVADFSSWL